MNTLITISGILIAKKAIFRRLNTSIPEGFFAVNEYADKVRMN